MFAVAVLPFVAVTRLPKCPIAVLLLIAVAVEPVVAVAVLPLTAMDLDVASDAQLALPDCVFVTP